MTNLNGHGKKSLLSCYCTGRLTLSQLLLKLRGYRESDCFSVYRPDSVVATVKTQCVFAVGPERKREVFPPG